MTLPATAACTSHQAQRMMTDVVILFSSTLQLLHNGVQEPTLLDSSTLLPLWMFSLGGVSLDSKWCLDQVSTTASLANRMAFQVDTLAVMTITVQCCTWPDDLSASNSIHMPKVERILRLNTVFDRKTATGRWIPSTFASSLPHDTRQ
jgi:hypothetical protein